MTLVLKNVKQEFLKEFQALADKAGAGLSVDVDECPTCKAHNYTLSKEVEKEILESLEELDQSRKNGTLKTYSSMCELERDLLA